MTDPTVEPSANLAHVDAPEKVADIDANIIERLVALNKADRGQAKVLREELATLEGKICQREIAIEALQGRKVAADRTARAVAKAAGGKVVDPLKSARAT